MKQPTNQVGCFVIQQNKELLTFVAAHGVNVHPQVIEVKSHPGCK